MATVNEKMTQLANAIRSKTGETSALTLDGMITAVNGITTGSGGSSYQLWGSHSFMAYDFDVSRYAGTYNVRGIYTWFYNSHSNEPYWEHDEVDHITVYADGNIDIYGRTCPAGKMYYADEARWTDEDELVGDDCRLLVYNIPNPITVSENLYKLFYALYDNGEWDLNVFQMGYDIGWVEGAPYGLPALGVLCDWSLMVDSGSSPILTLYNYHPFYAMECLVNFEGFDASVVVEPDEVSSFDINQLMYDIHGDDYSASGMQGGANLEVYDIRWS